MATPLHTYLYNPRSHNRRWKGRAKHELEAFYSARAVDERRGAPGWQARVELRSALPFPELREGEDGGLGAVVHDASGMRLPI